MASPAHNSNRLAKTECGFNQPLSDQLRELINDANIKPHGPPSGTIPDGIHKFPARR